MGETEGMSPSFPGEGGDDNDEGPQAPF